MISTISNAFKSAGSFCARSAMGLKRDLSEVVEAVKSAHKGSLLLSSLIFFSGFVAGGGLGSDLNTAFIPMTIVAGWGAVFFGKALTNAFEGWDRADDRARELLLANALLREANARLSQPRTRVYITVTQRPQMS